MNQGSCRDQDLMLLTATRRGLPNGYMLMKKMMLMEMKREVIFRERDIEDFLEFLVILLRIVENEDERRRENFGVILLLMKNEDEDKRTRESFLEFAV
ncbi:unnamed protein product [Vicia faba]|uniref:Uncharacterized protein n=1 Tax=Vicia faba TaxID=3906 RepID=A0AAV0ZQC2_VICFA|nr:unnamed protein product [Vicia faba]